MLQLVSNIFSQTPPTPTITIQIPRKFFYTSCLQGRAALQGVTLSDDQVQAVSGNIGFNILKKIFDNGEVPDKIQPIVDSDISTAVTHIPGIAEPLSFATGRCAICGKHTRLRGFYTTYFKEPKDWQIFYAANSSACAQTAVKFPGQIGDGVKECLMVVVAAQGVAQQQQWSIEAQGIKLIADAMKAAADWIINSIITPAGGAPLPQPELDTLKAFQNTAVINVTWW